MKRKRVIDKISNIVKSRHHEEATARRLLNTMYAYYIINDMENHRNYAEIFSLLYLTDHLLTYEKISDTCYISDRSLLRLVSRFNDLCIHLIKKIVSIKA